MIKILAESLLQTLQSESCIVVTAPPGTGKSTILPLEMLKAVKGKMIMLEPRRIAARQIAERMASLLGESVGKTIGYRMRFDTKVSAHTKIEVVTEGILTRMLVADPALEGVDAVIFDEFHERSLVCDQALALTRESKALLRPDLKIIIMSATIDAGEICRALGARLLSCEGREFPVEIKYAAADTAPADCARDVARCVSIACRAHDGDILAFLPGEAEIRRCKELLDSGLEGVKVYPLYGMLDFEEQRCAIAPARKGERKIVLATPVAETSITIEGVRVVVDSGYCRSLVFDASTSLSRLETVRISRDMAEQRAGRAGRTAPGVCYRLWTEASWKRMAECRLPEILRADLTGMVLDCCAWGCDSVGDLPWLTPPPVPSLRKAHSLLMSLGALDERSRITPEGKRLSSLPCHPRIAKMLLSAGTSPAKALACELAALLENQDPLAHAGLGVGLQYRIAQLRRPSFRDHLRASISQAAAQYRRLIAAPHDESTPDVLLAGRLLALAFPERVAKACEGGCGHFYLSGGGAAFVDQGDELAAEEWVSVGSMNSELGREGRIFLALPLNPEDVPELIRERSVLSWDAREGCVVARRERRLGKLLVGFRPDSGVPREKIVGVVCEAAAKEGLSMFDFSEAVENLQRRIAFVALRHPEAELPDVSSDCLLACALEWLPLYIGTASKVSELRKIDMCSVVWGRLDYQQQCLVDRLAPMSFRLPCGKNVRVEYRQGACAPVVRARLQDCFGLRQTPCVDGGRLPVLMELLSPGFKPVQLTSDLASFWSGTYFEVRKELRRRYPKHSWPEDPLNY